MVAVVVDWVELRELAPTLFQFIRTGFAGTAGFVSIFDFVFSRRRLAFTPEFFFGAAASFLFGTC